MRPRTVAGPATAREQCLAGARRRARGVVRARDGQRGFTIVEIAVVLLIMGIFVGLVLHGQQMVNSARARSLASMASEVQTAYFGFVDRYRRVPGDWNAADASSALGASVVGGGNDNGRVDTPLPGGDTYDEVNALWEHLAKAEFIRGAYYGNAGVEPDTGNGLAPLNAYNSVVLIGGTSDYEGTNSVRLHVVLGRGVPVEVMREVDLKMDDGVPSTGVLRSTTAVPTVFAGANAWGGREPTCVASGSGSPMHWDVASGARDCNGVLLF